MRILMISHEYPPVGGGGANACMNLARELGARGHEITVVTVWFEGLERFSVQNHVTVIRLAAKRKRLEHCGFAEMLSYLCRALRKADQIWKEKPFDVSMIFFAIPSGPVGYYLRKRYRVPYIIRFGGGDIPGFQDRFRAIYRLLGPLERIIWRNADALVANSRGLQRLAEAFYDRREIRIVPNGVELSAFERGEIRTKSEEFRILFVSRLIERKGLQFVIPQLKRLRHACRKPVRLTVVGDGPYRTRLERLAETEGVSDCVSFVGQKQKDELPDYYQNADVFILPSKKEGMPNVVLEAMASALPIVMTPCEGSEELIDGNGYAVETSAFSEKLAALAEDGELRRRMGKRSVRLVRERFLWSAAAAAYERILENACK